ncbi:MAG: amino acid adenylation domain-containing protein [Streptosporangiaceae bacterium]
MSETQTAMSPATAGQAAPSVYEAVKARARSSGGAAAVIGPHGAALSYGDLADRVDALASRLHAQGLGPERPVAVALERSADSIVAMLAVLAAGAVYCPVDAVAPPARTRANLQRLGVRAAVADTVNAAALGAGVLVLPPAGTAAGLFTTAQPHPDGLAYVLHTSGSTGVPKAVAMTHRGLDRLIAWQVGDGPPGLRTLQFTATSFDVTFQEVLSTLATGGSLVVASDEVRRDPDAMLDAIVTHEIQRLFLPYVALQLLAVAAVRRSVIPGSLEHVITAGERLIITPAIRDLFAAIPHCRLDNHYGPTEAHLVTSLTLNGKAEDWPEVPPIGTAVAGVSCRILDDRMQPAGDGAVGELYVAGTGLARGYLHDPGRTAERFVADPLAPGERLYRTGDLARAISGGGYEFLGRADRQLKVRGFRVEPAEVENALLQHPLVDAAAVGLRDLADGVPALVGYVQTGGGVPHRDLTEYLRDRLPAYMIPSRFVAVPALPRTSSGKVDGQALAALELPAAAEPPPAAAAASVADTITAIWQRVLGHDEFDAEDDFFDIGGDSLLATWVVAELTQELGCSIGLSAFLDYSTVADLAAAVEEDAGLARQRPRFSQLVTLRPGPSARSLYLVHPLGGELIGYRELARASSAPFRLLGIAWTGAPPDFGVSLADIARTHVEQLRNIQPDGPYLLAGWSFGGVLAYEIAQQLRRGGAAVDLLALLDANPLVDPLTGLPIAQTPFLETLDAVLARLDDPAGGGDGLAQLTSGPTWKQLMGVPITAGASAGYLRTVLNTARACMNAAMRYDPPPYDGPVTLFQAGGSGRARQEHLASAIRQICAGPLTAVELSGDHWGIMRGPDVTQTAAELDAALERAGAEGNAIDGS